MNDFARRHALPAAFDRQYFLSRAERGIMHPVVRLPANFHYDRIDHRKCEPQLFPAHADQFYLHASVAHDLISAAGAPVHLTHLLAVKKEGIVTFGAAEPFIDIQVSDLRLTSDQLQWLARKLLFEHEKTSSQVAEAQPVDAADATAATHAAPRPNVEGARTPDNEPTLSFASAPHTDAGLSKRERQIRAIEAEADRLGFQRLCVIKGGKKVIQASCKEKHVALFGAGDDPFIDAWKDAVKQGRMRTKHHDDYAGK
ncbi:hypothetical protein [Caballeronia sp. RCC_10]|uniref:hypothetical protein n=1 Tax=Caballeronia sp. RCC_10 TaxID=3239227 RepID=UPI003523A234